MDIGALSAAMTSQVTQSEISMRVAKKALDATKAEGDAAVSMLQAAVKIQKQAQGYAIPDSFTHGSSEQRQRWFQTGLKSGSVQACNTFAPSAQL